MSNYEKVKYVIRELELKAEDYESMACRTLDIEEDEDASNALEYRAMGVRDAISELEFLLVDIED